jgi:hypothetical protein
MTSAKLWAALAVFAAVVGFGLIALALAGVGSNIGTAPLPNGAAAAHRS